MAEDPQREVMSNLPRSRPVRRSAKRTAPGEGREATGREAGAKRATGAKRAAGAKRAGTAKRTSAAKRTTAAKSAAGAKRTTAGNGAKRPERPAPPAGWATPDEDAGGASVPGGVELVTTAVRAAGELAQIGVAAGTQVVRGLIRRIPKP